MRFCHLLRRRRTPEPFVPSPSYEPLTIETVTPWPVREPDRWPDDWSHDPIPAGTCGRCDATVEGYSRPPQDPYLPLNELQPPRPFTAHPCGHVQPQPIEFTVPLDGPYTGPYVIERKHP